MGMKQGYKQTDIGLIPEDWDAVPLLSKCDLLNGLTYTPDDVVNNGLLVLRSSNIQHSKLVFLDNVFVNLTVDKKQLVKKNDIIICVRNGSANLIGKCAKAEKDYNATFGAFMAVLRGVNNDYIYQILQQGTIQKLINKNSDSTINQITNGDFKSIKILFPAHKNERSRIAEALSDVDELIASLEKLIEKKKALKQGVMQELLTGKRRLPGFSGEWITLKVESIVSRFATGLNPRQNFKLNSGGENYYVTIKNFKDGVLFLDDNCDKIDDVALQRINERSDLKKDDLLFSSIGRIGDAYLIRETPTNWNINESVFALRPNRNIISPQMLFWLLTSENTTRKLVESTTGSTLKSIKLSHLKEIECTFPKDIEEQEAITSILFDLECEIERFEKKLLKNRRIKSGIMSELLTGRIRLV